MCGIVGYIGNKKVAPIVVEGLRNLEYRGYDSSGMALIYNNKIEVLKAQGKLENLDNLINKNKTAQEADIVGIGHIRWATHGIPNEINAHPHVSNCERIAVVHNGIIENYKELRKDLEAAGYKFHSQTDTETIVHMVANELKTACCLKDALKATLSKVKGAYALCVISLDEPDKIVVARKNAPLLIGVGEGENFVASDIPAIIEHTKKAIYLDDDEIAEVSKDDLKIYNAITGEKIEKKIEILPFEPVALSKMGYKHFMLKEINEQPAVVRKNLFGRLSAPDEPIDLKEVKLTKEDLKNLNRIQIIACGTSLHAAMVGKYIIEEFTGLPVDVEASSEYIYRNTITNKNTLVIGVSQSGETADTITAIRQAKAKGSHILIITNRVDSTMARDADSLICVDAGIEVSVAATKSYTAQLMSFYLLMLYLAEVKNSIDPEVSKSIKEELIQLPQKIEELLSHSDRIAKCAKIFASTKDFIFIARGINFPVALEGALKLKEISYINATGYSAGELKHGPIAMLDESMPVLAILIPGIVYDKVLSNSEESKARNARLIALTSADDEHLNSIFEYIIKIPEVSDILSPIITTVPLQLLAYYIAEFLGKDVDQPRNLAKSVTVE
ncbi:MAG: glutamine--fructose-6-phosphate transaminase (isomerizing) [Candidatus Gastranaerophilales bacterium]|nr:glutamine--fructose-6-phosphate transaminase (isomerizing) [Candidatus Gastranaerophilales bacterium]